MDFPTTFMSDEAMVTWLQQQQIPTQQIELLSQQPWEKHYRIHTDHAAHFYLRLTPLNVCLKANLQILQTKTLPTEQLLHSDIQQGLIAYQEPAGNLLTSSPSHQQRCQLLSHYAQLQTQALEKPLERLLAYAPPQQSLQQLFDFLAPNLTGNKLDKHQISADFFITTEEAQGYAQAIASRQILLQPYFEQLQALPLLLEHGQLDTQHIFETYQSELLFKHWERACFAPAGFSLSTLFQGAHHLAYLLDDFSDLSPEELQQKQQINIYINTLVEAGYSDTHILKTLLPFTALLGHFQHICHYANYGFDEFDYKKRIGHQIRDTLESIVHLCDYLALMQRDTTLHYANDYFQNGVPWRASKLLKQYVNMHPNDLETQQTLGEVCLYSGDWQGAINSFSLLVDKQPQHALWQSRLGEAYLKNKQSDLALRHLERATQLEPQNADLTKLYQRAKQLQHYREQAKIPHLAPTLRLSDVEKKHNQVEVEHLDLATEFFREYGNVVIENIFPKSLIHTISKIVFERYNNYFEDRHYEDNLVLGDKRRMVTLELSGALNDVRIYGNALVTHLMKRLLGDDYVMGGLNAVVSLPGAKDQGLHKDYPPLFPNDDEQYHVTPPFAIAMLIPLIEMREEHGTTEFRKGSHLVPEQMPHHMPTQTPIQQIGDCVIFDYRTAHEGLANRSNDVRPMLCVIFHRVWFRDALNYEQQADVPISPEELAKVPAELKHLFKWVGR